MPREIAQDIENLKSEGRYFHAGALAYVSGHDNSYGCHFGMRSTRDSAAEQFRLGYVTAKDAFNHAHDKHYDGVYSPLEG